MSTNKCNWNGVSSKKAEMECNNNEINAGYYAVQDYKNAADSDKVKSTSLNCPVIISQDGYGWGGYKGVKVDQDSKLRVDPTRLTHSKGRHALDRRNNETGYKGRGPLAVDVESILKTANFLPCQKLNSTPQPDVTEFKMNYLPPENNPQCVKHIIPACISEGGWVRGGMDTRMELRKNCKWGQTR
jgi:hypothetical protein